MRRRANSPDVATSLQRAVITGWLNRELREAERAQCGETGARRAEADAQVAVVKDALDTLLTKWNGRA